MDTYKQTENSQTENWQINVRKLAYIHETDNLAANYSGVYMFGH